MEAFEGHKPVLYKEVMELLQLRHGDTIVDGTLGGAGHAKGILERIAPDGFLIGIDKDATAIERGKERLKEYERNIVLIRNDFKQVTSILDELHINKVNGALLDLGVSSFQLDQAERGFSYHQDAPLDMRMNQSSALTAYEVVNRYSEEDLCKLIREYGEEKWAARIAKFVVEDRQIRELETTQDLVRTIKKAIPRAVRSDGGHPARKTFQAIRIEVNGELSGLETALEQYVGKLEKNGRLAVITFHSLEDRIVKQTFKRLQDPCECPKDFPVCVCGKQSQVKIVTRKPVMPAEEEIQENPRARSAKLRVVEKR
ncbi:16S rRNA (cytosine(1402)-N(4))-methyltransferase RsmH [Christensenellaceae bacterium OttesenSCG-928-K19]|nr:16S rRNA (cytosine(1402)-N(4))-methyltransferase RsmH [Christensenellaceae bacterium OttesenSCG-928-K19]